jgi:hypothetical protein
MEREELRTGMRKPPIAMRIRLPGGIALISERNQPKKKCPVWVFMNSAHQQGFTIFTLPIC